jgi:hypothetical protein
MDNDHYEVPGIVPLMQQAGVTCWAAATAMMINWHKNRGPQSSRTMTIEETLRPLGGAPHYPEGTTY